MSAAPRVEALEEGRSRVWIRAQPGARRSGVVGLWNDHLKVAVRSPAEDGRANEELLDVVSEALGIRRSAVELLRGATARTKELGIALPADELRTRLLAALAEA